MTRFVAQVAFGGFGPVVVDVDFDFDFDDE